MDGTDKSDESAIMRGNGIDQDREGVMSLSLYYIDRVPMHTCWYGYTRERINNCTNCTIVCIFCIPYFGPQSGPVESGGLLTVA
jgi:hypothetical protein